MDSDDRDGRVLPGSRDHPRLPLEHDREGLHNRRSALPRPCWRMALPVPHLCDPRGVRALHPTQASGDTALRPPQRGTTVGHRRRQLGQRVLRRPKGRGHSPRAAWSHRGSGCRLVPGPVPGAQLHDHLLEAVVHAGLSDHVVGCRARHPVLPGVWVALRQDRPQDHHPCRLPYRCHHISTDLPADDRTRTCHKRCDRSYHRRESRHGDLDRPRLDPSDLRHDGLRTDRGVPR